MRNSSQLKEHIESFRSDWNLTSLNVFGQTNSVELTLVGVDDDNSSATGRTALIVCSELVNLSYSPHLLETLPSLLDTTTLEEIREETGLKKHEGFWQTGRSGYGAYMPFHRLTMRGWKFRLEVICRSIQIREESI